VRLEEQAQAGQYLIQGYGDGGFRIAGKRHQGSIVLGPAGVEAWAVVAPGDIDYDRLKPALDAARDVDVLLVGCGPAMTPVDRGLIGQARDSHGIAVDFMDTGAACRTYNVLLMDGRRVAAALIAVG